VDNPARGMYMETMCEEKWEVALQQYFSGQKQILQMPDVTPEQLRQLDVCITPPTLMNIANELMILPVEKKGNYCPDLGTQLNLYSISPTNPHFIWVNPTKERQGGVYQVPPRGSPDNLTCGAIPSIPLFS